MVAVFTWEYLDDLLDDGLSVLAYKAWEEVEEDKDGFPFDVNWFRYREMEATGNFRFFTARVDGELVGYAGVSILPDLRSRKVTHAVVLDIYVEPEQRHKGVGVKLLHSLEDWLGKLGVNCVTVGERNTVSTGRLYQRMGYKCSERAWTKAIKRS